MAPSFRIAFQRLDTLYLTIGDRGLRDQKWTKKLHKIYGWPLYNNDFFMLLFLAFFYQFFRRHLVTLFCLAPSLTWFCHFCCFLKFFEYGFSFSQYFMQEKGYFLTLWNHEAKDQGVLKNPYNWKCVVFKWEVSKLKVPLSLLCYHEECCKHKIRFEIPK